MHCTSNRAITYVFIYIVYVIMKNDVYSYTPTPTHTPTHTHTHTHHLLIYLLKKQTSIGYDKYYMYMCLLPLLANMYKQ